MREGDNMRLYTSTGTRKTIEQCNALNIGLLMVDVWRNPDDWPSFAIDNGCYAAYNREEEWDPAPFLKILTRCKKEGRNPDFIVIPDKVADPKSILFSLVWIPVLESMYPEFPRYLAVQNGMSPEQVLEYVDLRKISGIFVGGTMEWKMDTMKGWVMFAHEYGLKCHVGRIGPIKRMMICELAGADSIDSTTWVQNRDGIEHYVGGFNAQTRIEDHPEGVRWMRSAPSACPSSGSPTSSSTSGRD